MKKLIEKVRECNLPLAAALGTWLIFLVLHTVVYRVNFEDHAGNLGYLLRAAAVLILLILFICSVISIKKILDYNWPWDMDDELLDELLSFDDEMGEAGSKAMGAAEDAVGSKTMDAAGSKAMSAAGVTAGSKAMSAAGVTAGSKTMGAAEVTAGSKAMGAAGDVAENREDYDIWDMEEDYETFEAGSGTLYKSLLVVFALSLLFLVMLVLEVCTTSFSLYVDRDYIFAGAIAVDKTYLYDVILIFAFPLWTQVIFKGMKEKNFHYTSVISACLQLTMLTVMQFLLYMEHSGIWMLELAAVDLLTLSAAVRKYTGESHGKRKNTVHFTVFYAALWFGLLLLLHNSGRGLLQYIADGSWRRYMENVFFLMRNAAISGPAYALQTNMRIYEFLFNNNDYLQSALYYWGWKAVLEILLALFVFLAATRKLLGKSMEYNENYLIYHAAWWSLALRVLAGIPYSLGLLPLPINLPFAGAKSVYLDTAALVLLLWCSWENAQAEKARLQEAGGEACRGPERGEARTEETYWELESEEAQPEETCGKPADKDEKEKEQTAEQAGKGKREELMNGERNEGKKGVLEKFLETIRLPEEDQSEETYWELADEDEKEEEQTAGQAGKGTGEEPVNGERNERKKGVLEQFLESVRLSEEETEDEFEDELEEEFEEEERRRRERKEIRQRKAEELFGITAYDEDPEDRTLKRMSTRVVIGLALLALVVTWTSVEKIVRNMNAFLDTVKQEELKIEEQGTKDPEMENPGAESPEMENPKVENPGAEDSGMENPEMNNPEIEEPEYFGYPSRIPDSAKLSARAETDFAPASA